MPNETTDARRAELEAMDEEQRKALAEIAGRVQCEDAHGYIVLRLGLGAFERVCNAMRGSRQLAS